MEEVLKLIAQHYASCMQRDDLVWKIEEALDGYIDKRIEEALRHYKLEYRTEDY